MTFQNQFNGILKGRDIIGECWVVETKEGQQIEVSEYDLTEMSDQQCMSLHFARKVSGTYEETDGKSMLADSQVAKKIKVTSFNAV